MEREIIMKVGEDENNAVHKEKEFIKLFANILIEISKKSDNEVSEVYIA